MTRPALVFALALALDEGRGGYCVKHTGRMRPPRPDRPDRPDRQPNQYSAHVQQHRQELQQREEGEGGEMEEVEEEEEEEEEEKEEEEEEEEVDEEEEEVEKEEEEPYDAASNICVGAGQALPDNLVPTPSALSPAPPSLSGLLVHHAC